MSFKLIPSSYSGTVGEYFSNYILPNLPKEESVKSIHQMLIEYLDIKNLLVIRTFGSIFPLDKNKKPIRGKIIESKGYRLIGSDNEAAVWFFVRCFEENYPHKKIEKMIDSQCFPIADGRAPRTDDWSCFGRPDQLILKNFLHAHMFAAKEKVDEDDYLARMIRLLHPINHCLVPSRKFIREGDVSEIPGLKEHVTNYWKSVLPKEWEEFCLIAKPYFKQLDNSSMKFKYSERESLSVGSATSEIEVTVISEDMKKLEDSYIAQNGWDINIVGNDASNRENTGNISESFLDKTNVYLKLFWRESKNQQTYFVGNYILNIKSLLEKGIVYRDGGNGPLRLKIQHDRNGHFYIRRTKDGLSKKL